MTWTIRQGKSLAAFIILLVIVTLFPIPRVYASPNQPTFVSAAGVAIVSCCDPAFGDPLITISLSVVTGNALILGFGSVSSTLKNLTFTDSLGTAYKNIVNTTDVDTGKANAALYVGFAPSSGVDTITGFTRNFATVEAILMQYTNVKSFGSNNSHEMELTNVCPPCPPLATDNWNVGLFQPLSAAFIVHFANGAPGTTNSKTTYTSLGTLRLNETSCNCPNFPFETILGVDTDTGVSGTTTNISTSGTSHVYDAELGVQLNTHSLQGVVDTVASILPIFSILIFSMLGLVFFTWHKITGFNTVFFPEGSISFGSGGREIRLDLIIMGVLVLVIVVSIVSIFNTLS